MATIGPEIRSKIISKGIAELTSVIVIHNDEYMLADSRINLSENLFSFSTNWKKVYVAYCAHLDKRKCNVSKYSKLHKGKHKF